MINKIFLSILMIITLGYAKDDIIIFHAGSLSIPFAQIEKAFESKYPNFDIKREASGSRLAARKVSDIKRDADIVASADYKVIDNLLIPQNAKFNIQFATNEMAIAYTPKSKYAKDINSTNWTEILLKKGVKVGHSNPNVDPCGYRSILVTKLAQIYYNKPDFYNQLLGYKEYYKIGNEQKDKVIVRPKETDLLALLEVGAIDYLFIYKSVAKQHKLNYIELPPKISLQSSQYNDYYKQVSFKISGKKPGEFITKKGLAMIYGVTIVQNHKSPHNKKGAITFMKFLLSKDAQDIIKQNGQTPIVPPIITGDDSILKEK